MASMLVSIDPAGRVVIPKDVRERLSLTPETDLEVLVQDDTIVLAPVRRPGRRVVTVDGWPVIEPVAGRSISDADVQRWRDAASR